MRSKLILTLLAFLALPLVPVAADHDPGAGVEPCPEWVQYVPADAETRSSPVYVAADETMPGGHFFSIWIYAESNGLEGLQRHDWCANGPWAENHDLILF